ncbi:hypothetical protein DPMN_125316 [Dreissena polymorpha]|uniref:Uncharacterized protein n=1 Tax=Dreissena polymorpha TaxID=45954 RepID=A0A9D4GUX1_DREPO|nr:hypothetical protein DPMN_125316 [Dreissena polymorpha]
MTDNTSVNVKPFHDKLYVATETKYWNQMDPETLDRKENVRKAHGETPCSNEPRSGKIS